MNVDNVPNHTENFKGINFSWPESRVLFEILKKRFITGKLVLGSKGIKKLYLTNTGNEEAEQIDRNGDKQIYEKLKNMDKEDCDRLCEAMALIENILRKNDKQ